MLLSLPPELKDQIYRLVCGDSTLHIYKLPLKMCHDHRESSRAQPFRHLICTTELTEVQAQRNFDKADATKPDNKHTFDDNEKRHSKCLIEKDDDLDAHQTLNLALLRTCRQIYHEARLIPTATNTFAFNCPVFLEHFIQRSMRPPLELYTSIRHLQLEIAYKHQDLQDRWARALRSAAPKLPAVTHLHVNLEQVFCVCWAHEATFALRGENELLCAVRGMRFPRLRVATVVVCDGDYLSKSEWLRNWDSSYEEFEVFRWTLEEKRSWAGETRKVLMGGGEEVAEAAGEEKVTGEAGGKERKGGRV